ncbi:MAG: glycosyltransferase family 2 protein [Lachnospiraceae bacterium]|nr:glycosyltransferase family 2 protein [Lachnospiraceae bacterium]
MNKLSVIVTVYKNEKNLRPFYENFKEEIAPHLDDYEIVMVNDDSPDNSWEVMQELAKEDNKVKLVKLIKNFGAVAASFTGLQCATGDCATIKAADLQEPASLTLEMYERWKSGDKSVIAVRKSRKDAAISNLFSNTYYALARKLITKDMPKGGFDTYLIDRTIIDYIVKQKDKNSPITLQLLWMGCGKNIVYYDRLERKIGKSSWTFKKKFNLFMDSFVGFSYIPIRIMTVVGILFALVSAIYAIHMVIAALKGEVDVRGYTTLVVILSFSAGMIMFSLGILGEYIWRTLDASRRRPISIIEEKVNFDEK